MSQIATPALREQIRAQVRRALAQGLAASARPAAAPATPALTGSAHGSAAVVVPLRVSSASDSQALTELIKRLGASPALLQATQNGLLRFDLRVDAAMPTTMATSDTQPAPTAAASAPGSDCCDACKAGKTCACGEQGCDHAAAATAPQAPLLEGVVSEKRIKSLAAGVKTVRLHPSAVLTPLGKEALRKRGITIERGATP